MSAVKSISVFNEVVDEATKQFRFMYEEVDGERDIFEKRCDLLDTLISELDCEAYDVEVDRYSKEIILSIVGEYIEISSSSSTFLELADCSKKLLFKVSDDGNCFATVSFVFDGIWNKKTAL